MEARILSAVPRWLLNPLTKMAMAGKDRKASGDDVTIPMLAPHPALPVPTRR